MEERGLDLDCDPSKRADSNEQRLTSLRPPRDLTLSQSQSKSQFQPRKAQHKKTFAPNLKVVRNKNKSVSFEGGGSDRRGDKGERNNRHGNARNSNAGRTQDRKHRQEGHNVLKSQGVFSEGMAAVAKFSSKVGYSGLQKAMSTRGDSGALQRPVIDRHGDKQISEDLSNIDIKDILKEEGDEDALMTTFCPIKLPLLSNNSPIIETNTKSGKNYDKSAELFGARTTPTLLLMQFPDNLPGRGPENTTNKLEDMDPEPNNVCKVNSLEEGLVGKIVIYKSGKVKLVIGNTDYDLNIGMQPRFQQDVISVNTNVEERNGNAIHIGHIQNKLIIVPQWETLFHRAAATS